MTLLKMMPGKLLNWIYVRMLKYYTDPTTKTSSCVSQAVTVGADLELVLKREFKS